MNINRTTHLMILLVAVFALSAWQHPWSIVSVAQAQADKGLVVFSREDTMKGKAIRFNIEQDGRPVGQLLAGTTIELPLTPGSYNFTVRAPSLDGQDFLTVDVKAGRTYYIEGEILWGWPTGRPKFKFVSESGSAVTSSSAGSADRTAPAPAPDAANNALAGATLGSATPSNSNAAGAGAERTAEERGRIGLRNFVGDWQLKMWSLAADGTKLEGTGRATGSTEGNHATRIVFSEFSAAAFPAATGGGHVLISHVSDKGFTLESEFQFSGERLRFSGQYDAATGRYAFYQFGGAGGQTATGMQRSSVRVEIRSLDIGTWVADTYSSVDGQSVHVQSYEFTRQ